MISIGAADPYSVLDIGFDHLLVRGGQMMQGALDVTPEMTNVISGGVSSKSLVAGELVDYINTGSAGISGVGTLSSEIRIWAGSAYADRGTAPFRVDQAGNVVMTSATISGAIDIGGSDSTSFHVDVDGNMWLGAATFAAAPASISKSGAGIFSSIVITGGSITGTPIAGIPNNSSTDISLLDLTHDLLFSVTDLDTVGWASGTITMSNGRTFSINSGNTGDMTVRTYVYLDTGTSSTVLQTTTSVSTAIGANKKLIAVCQNGRAQPQFTVYGGIGGLKIPASGTGIENNNWGFSGTWSITDADTIAWSAGTLTTSDGGSYSISGGNTGNMAAKTYVFFDLAFSSTVFNTTTTASSSVDVGKILIAICQNGTTEATFIVVNDKSLNIDAANIVAGSITANEIAAGTITAAKMNVTQLSAIAADLGTITAGSINIGSGNATIASTGNAVFKNVDIGVTNITIDNTGDIATQVAAISAAGGGVLHLKAGTYTVNAAIAIPSSVRIVGQSFSTTTINFNSTAANFTLTGGNLYTTGTISSIVTGTTVNGSGTTWTAGMVGRWIFINNRWYQIVAFVSVTQIIIASAYADGATYSGTYRISSVIQDVVIQDVTLKSSTGTAIACTDIIRSLFYNVILLTNNKGITISNSMEVIIRESAIASSTSNGYEITNGSFFNAYNLASVANGGHGAVLNTLKTSGFLFCAADSNTLDGFNLTSCNNLDITVEASGNGSQGFELVSGNDSILIHNGFYQNNTSDGVKLTASSNNCVIDDSNITGNGGYGINLAASSDTDNRVVNCHFASNTSGNKNDLGTGTLLRANIGVTDNSVSNITTNIFGDASDGTVVVGGTTTLTRDMFYNNLTLGATDIINTASFRVFVRGTLTIASGGKIRNNGNNGSAGTNGASSGAGAVAGGAGGAAVASGSLPAGEDGKTGGAGTQGDATNPQPGNPGIAGDDVAKSLGGAGATGGAGGNSGAGSGGAGDSGGAGGAGGAQTGTIFNSPRSPLAAYLLLDTFPTVTGLLGSAGSGSGGGGAGGCGNGGGGAGSAPSGGGGGGSGSTGGSVVVFANIIVNASTAGIQATGGTGGNGGNGGTDNTVGFGGGGGGGGGAGGDGGFVIVVYNTKSGAGTFTAAGGAGGTGGVRGTGGTANGVAGSNGPSGNAGVVYDLVLIS